MFFQSLKFHICICLDYARYLQWISYRYFKGNVTTASKSGGTVVSRITIMIDFVNLLNTNHKLNHKDSKLLFYRYINSKLFCCDWSGKKRCILCFGRQSSYGNQKIEIGSCRQTWWENDKLSSLSQILWKNHHIVSPNLITLDSRPIFFSHHWHSLVFIGIQMISDPGVTVIMYSIHYVNV